MDANGGNPINLTQEPLFRCTAHLVTRRKTNCVCFQPGWNGDIYAMNADGGNVTELTHDDTNRPHLIGLLHGRQTDGILRLSPPAAVADPIFG